MSYAPSTLLALRAYLQPRTGLSPASLGIVGDAAHARRASYHNGWDRVTAYGRTAATDYTIRTTRDRALPRTAAASAIDIGTFAASKGGAAKLRHMSAWLVAQTRANTPGTRTIREIIYSPDGRTVLRWDRERGVNSAPRTGEADDSHRWHTHISWYRNAEKIEKVAIFREYFEPHPIPSSPAYKVTIPSGRPVQLYYSNAKPALKVSGLTLIVRNRLPAKVGGLWLYQIVEGKYRGRYVAPTGDTKFSPIERS